MPPRNRSALLALSLLGILVAVGLVWTSGVFKPPRPQLIGGPFQLVDQNGRPTTEKALKGQWNAVFFGFTYCPDVCPGTLQALTAATERLGPKARDLKIVFISVDPGRDNPTQMKAYLAAGGYPASTLGLTGTPEQVAAAAKAYRVYYQKAGDGDAYLVNHSSTVYLMDPKGRFDRPLAYGLTPDQMADQIKAAMAGR
ncbi:MAG: electron transport protein SCO1/SenC [Caulobacter sp.]|nr:electron transport protein SCO1/SenC [Caulobacter sp.]